MVTLTWPTLAARQGHDAYKLGPGISQRFKANGGHTGLDFYWLSANPTESKQIHGQYGVVDRIVLNDPGYGNCCYIRVSDRMVVAHAHMASIAVKAGAKVTPDTVIGVMGQTGSKANWVHLHLSVQLDGKTKFAQETTAADDPYPYFTTKAVPGTLVNPPTSTASTASTASQQVLAETESDMFLVRRSDGLIALWTGLGWAGIGTQTQLAAAQAFLKAGKANLADPTNAVTITAEQWDIVSNLIAAAGAAYKPTAPTISGNVTIAVPATSLTGTIKVK